jgi:hypothetical protein
MSHISENQTGIETVNESILEETIELLVRGVPGLEVCQGVQQIHSLEGTPRKVDLALFTPAIKRGIGINFKGGKGLTFVGDGWGYAKEYQELQDVLLQTYNVVGVRKALESLNYDVAAPEQIDREQVMLECVHA